MNITELKDTPFEKTVRKLSEKFYLKNSFTKGEESDPSRKKVIIK